MILGSSIMVAVSWVAEVMRVEAGKACGTQASNLKLFAGALSNFHVPMSSAIPHSTWSGREQNMPDQPYRALLQISVLYIFTSGLCIGVRPKPHAAGFQTHDLFHLRYRRCLKPYK